MGAADDHEAEIIRQLLRVAAGERDLTPRLTAAREAMFTRLRPPLVGYCSRLLRNDGLGEDLAHHAIETAWKKLPDFRGEGKFRSFVFGIATKLCYRALRDPSVRLYDPEVLELAGVDPTPLELLTRDERKRMVRFVMEGLPDLERDVVYLRFYESLSYDAIERVLEIDLEERKSGARGLLVSCKRHLSARVAKWLADNRHGLSFLRGEG